MEIEHIPLCFTGMSRGGMSMQLAELMPERTIATVPVCLEVGPTSKPTRSIPVMTVFGEKDGSQMEKLLAKLPMERKESARWGIAVQWNRKHEFGQANNLSFVFMDDVISRRLPKEPLVDKPTNLAEIPLEEGWLSAPSGWSKEGKRPTIQAWNEFTGDREQVCWFPSERTARIWQAFVSSTKDVVIAEPAGLGDGQAFTLHSSKKPVKVQLTISDKLKPEKVELWNGRQRLMERTEAPWTFEVELKPGINGLFATVHESGREVKSSRPHTIVVGE